MQSTLFHVCITVVRDACSTNKRLTMQLSKEDKLQSMQRKCFPQPCKGLYTTGSRIVVPEIQIDRVQRKCFLQPRKGLRTIVSYVVAPQLQMQSGFCTIVS